MLCRVAGPRPLIGMLEIEITASLGLLDFFVTLQTKFKLLLTQKVSIMSIIMAQHEIEYQSNKELNPVQMVVLA